MPCLTPITLLIALLLLAGCSSYAIKGRVIRGPIATVQVVDDDDPRLTESNGTGGGAIVSAVLEPDTPSERRELGKHIADGQGWFAIPADAFGSGLLEYEAQVLARRDGNQGAFGKIDLPGRSERVLITLPLGEDRLRRPNERFLDKTLRDAKPYLDENR